MMITPLRYCVSVCVFFISPCYGQPWTAPHHVSPTLSSARQRRSTGRELRSHWEVTNEYGGFQRNSTTKIGDLHGLPWQYHDNSITIQELTNKSWHSSDSFKGMSTGTSCVCVFNSRCGHGLCPSILRSQWDPWKVGFVTSSRTES